MKQSLREAQEARVLRDTIATLKTQIEYLLWLVKQDSNIGSTIIIEGEEGGNSFLSVPTVISLPAIPTTFGRFQMVFWTSSGGGTGDDQPWWTYYGYNRWFPMKFSTRSGLPGSEELL